MTLRQQLLLKRNLRRLRTWAPPISMGVIIGAGAFMLAERIEPATATPAPAVVMERVERPRLEALRSTPSRAYSNCEAARAAGAAPIRAGEPGFGAHLDADGDGIGCEPYYGR
jgi:hypothetical protein